MGAKVELAVTFPGGTDEVVLFQGPDVMLRDPVVNGERIGELVDITRLVAEKIDDPAPIGSAAGPSENVP